MCALRECSNVAELDGPALNAFALSELQSLREGFDGFRTRVSRLEYVLTKAIASANVTPVPKSEPALPPCSPKSVCPS